MPEAFSRTPNDIAPPHDGIAISSDSQHLNASTIHDAAHELPDILRRRTFEKHQILTLSRDGIQNDSKAVQVAFSCRNDTNFVHS